MNIGGLTVPDPVVGALSTILVSVIGGIIYFEYKRRRRSTDQTKEWYAEAIGIIGRLQQAGQQTTMFAQETNEEAIKSKFEPIATELQSHAGNAPEQVEDQARAELIYLSTIASAIISLSDQSEDASISAVFQEAQELARENSTVDYDLEEINERFDLGNLGSGKEQIEESDINEEALSEFVESLSEESKQKGQIATPDDIFEMPIDKLEEAIDSDQFWNQFLDDMIQQSIEVFLLEVSGDIYEAMEERK